MNPQLVAPQMDLTVSYMEGREEASPVATDGQPPVANGAPVFQHLLARLFNPSQPDQSENDASSEEVLPSGIDAPIDGTAEESSQTVSPPPETTQAVLARFASPVVQAPVTPPSVSAPPPAPPSDVKSASTPPEIEREQSLPAPAHITTPFQPPLVNRSPSTTPTNGSMSRQPSTINHQPSTINHQPSTIAPSSVFQSFQEADVVQSVEEPRVSLPPGVEQEKTLTAARWLSVKKATPLPTPQRAAPHQGARLPTDDFISPLLPLEREGVAHGRQPALRHENRSGWSPELVRGWQPPNPQPVRDSSPVIFGGVTTQPPLTPDPSSPPQERGRVAVAPLSRSEGEGAELLRERKANVAPSFAESEHIAQRENAPPTLRHPPPIPPPAGSDQEKTKAGGVEVNTESEVEGETEPTATFMDSVTTPSGAQPDGNENEPMQAVRAQVPAPETAMPQSIKPVAPPLVPVTARTAVQTERQDIPSMKQREERFPRPAADVTRAPSPVNAQVPIGRQIKAQRVALSEGNAPIRTEQRITAGARVEVAQEVKSPVVLPTPMTERKDVPSAARFSVQEVESQPPRLPMTSSVRPAHLPPPSANDAERGSVNHGAADTGSEMASVIEPSMAGAETVTTQSIASFPPPSVPAVEQTAEQTKRQAAIRLSEDLNVSPPDRARWEITRTDSDTQHGFEIGSEEQVHARSSPQSVDDGQMKKGAATTGQERVKGRGGEIQDSPSAPDLGPAASSVSKVRNEHQGRENSIEPNTENETVNLIAPAETFGIPASSPNVVQSNGDEQRDPTQRNLSAPKAEVVAGAVPTGVLPLQHGQEWHGHPDRWQTQWHGHPDRWQFGTGTIENNRGGETADIGRKGEADLMSATTDPSTSSESSVPFYSVSIQNHSAERVMVVPASRSLSTPTAMEQSVIHQIVREARVRFGRGETEMTLRLQPPHLGRLRLRLVWSGNELTAQMDAESQSVKQLLETNLPALYRSLSEQGIRVDHVTVSIGQHFAASPFADANPFAHNARQQESMGQFLRPQTPEPQTPEPQTPGLTTLRSVVSGQRSAVDYWA